MNPAPAPAPSPAHPNSRPTTSPPRRFERGGHAPSRGGIRPGGASRRIQRILRRPTFTPTRMSNAVDYYPETPAENVVRIVPLGGVEEVGRNMVAIDRKSTRLNST